MAQSDDIMARKIGAPANYPAGQAPRSVGDTTIRAKVFREADRVREADPNGGRFRPAPQSTAAQNRRG